MRVLPLPKMSERELQKAVVDMARQFGWLVHHGKPAPIRGDRWITPVQGDSGFPDLIMSRHGSIVIAELKAERGRLSEGQQEWMLELSGQPGWGYSRTSESRPLSIDQYLQVVLWTPDDWRSGAIERVLR